MYSGVNVRASVRGGRSGPGGLCPARAAIYVRRAGDRGGFAERELRLNRSTVPTMGILSPPAIIPLLLFNGEGDCLAAKLGVAQMELSSKYPSGG